MSQESGDNKSARRLKNKLRALQVVGAALCLWGIWGLWQDFQFMSYLDDTYPRPTGSYPYHWWQITILLVLGFVLLVLASEMKDHYFRKIVGEATIVGTDYSPQGAGLYYLVVEGPNRAGQRIRRHVSVGPRTYNEAQIGSIFKGE